MNNYFFISDAHLGAEDKHKEKHKEKMLSSFLNHINKKGNTLYIVGDLFDFWFEYKHVIPGKHFKIVCLLKKLAENGVKIKYITGNHDFCLGNFIKNIGIEVHTEPIVTSIQRKQFYISHGDGLLKKDYGYRILKKILRNSINIKLYSLLHPDIGIAFAHLISNLSRNNRIINNTNSDYINFAKLKFNEGFDIVILAHTHIPLEFKENNKIFINTGDWINHFSYGQIEKNKLSLKYWKIPV